MARDIAEYLSWGRILGAEIILSGESRRGRAFPLLVIHPDWTDRPAKLCAGLMPDTLISSLTARTGVRPIVFCSEI
jgi:hypothetical protein